MPICLRLLVQAIRLAASRTRCTAGISRPIRTAMMAMTTSSSRSVKAGRFTGGSSDGPFSINQNEGTGQRKGGNNHGRRPRGGGGPRRAGGAQARREPRPPGPTSRMNCLTTGGDRMSDPQGYVLGQSEDAARRLEIQDSHFAEASEKL